MKQLAVLLAVTVICLYTSNSISLAQHKHQETKSVSKGDSSHVGHYKKKSKESAVITTAADTQSTLLASGVNHAASIRGIVDSYLQLKNALANDKTNNAAAAGKKMVEAIGMINTLSLSAEQKKLLGDAGDDAREHAEHIGANAGNIAHQREHFEMLSKDVYDLVKAFGSEQVIYKNYCPMYNDKKGAIWLSETKTIKNPYYGKKMLNCGSVKEEIK